MKEELTLYDFKNDSININIVARFENEKLIIDGYDIGKTVKEVWGDSDYEYVLTLPEESVLSLCKELKVDFNNHLHLLEEIGKRFHGNSCFSDIAKYLTTVNIPYERFSWT